MSDPPGEKLELLWLQKSASAAAAIKPETQMLFTYPGWDQLIAGLAPTTPEEALERQSKEIKAKWDDLTKPHSPLTPEAAAASGLTFETGVNIAYGALTALATGIEAAGLGQLETPAMMLPHAPILRATFDAASAIRRAYLDASIIKGVGYKAHADHQPTIISEGILTAAFNMGLIDDVTFKGQMMYHGYTLARSEVIGKTGVRMPDLETILRLRRRGQLSDKGAADWLVLSRTPRATAESLVTLWAEIPPAADLVRMVVREAFDPKMVVTAPAVFAEYMAKQGYAKEWSDRYWTAHFEPIELRTAYENVWRGHWTKDQFMYALHIKDIHPAWRDDIWRIVYHAPSMRELAYGYDVGEFSEKEIAEFRRWGGLSPLMASKAAKAMVAYRTEAEREAVRREHMHLFALGKESMEQFGANLKRLGTAPAAVPLWKERAELEKARREKEPAFPEQRTISSSEALAALNTGIRDEAWTRQKLADLAWTPERIDLAIEKAPILDTGVDEANRIRTVLLEKAREGFLKLGDLETRLLTLGFSAYVTGLSLEYAELSQEWDDISEQASAWWTLAKAGKISSEEYAAEVRKLGMVEERITSKQKLLAKLAEIRMAEAAAKAKA